MRFHQSREREKIACHCTVCVPVHGIMRVHVPVYDGLSVGRTRILSYCYYWSGDTLLLLLLVWRYSLTATTATTGLRLLSVDLCRGDGWRTINTTGLLLQNHAETAKQSWLL
eukprot:scpid9810/ scgid23165/ 